MQGASYNADILHRELAVTWADNETASFEPAFLSFIMSFI